MEVFLTYLIGIVDPLKHCLVMIGVFSFLIAFFNPNLYVGKVRFLRGVILIFSIFVLSYLIPDSQTCVAMLNAMKP